MQVNGKLERGPVLLGTIKRGLWAVEDAIDHMYHGIVGGTPEDRLAQQVDQLRRLPCARSFDDALTLQHDLMQQRAYQMYMGRGESKIILSYHDNDRGGFSRVRRHVEGDHTTW